MGIPPALRNSVFVRRHWGSDGKADKDVLVSAFKQADEECGSCGCGNFYFNATCGVALKCEKAHMGWWFCNAPYVIITYRKDSVLTENKHVRMLKKCMWR